VAFSPDGKILATAAGHFNEAGEVKVWNTTTGTEVATVAESTADIGRLKFSPDGKTLACAGWNKDAVILWDMQIKKVRQKLPRAPDEGAVRCLAFAPDGNTLATGTWRSAPNTPTTHIPALKLWDLQTGQVKRTLTDEDNQILLSLEFSPDGRLLAGTSGKGALRIWDIKTGDFAHVPSSQMAHVAFSPDGKTFATAEWDKTVRIWDVQTRRALRTLIGHSDRLRAVAFSPDGKLLASGGVDGIVCVWDSQTGEWKHTLSGHTGGIQSLAFSPDGKCLATGSDDMMVRLWRLPGQPP
jgi:WD40 repeat protein